MQSVPVRCRTPPSTATTDPTRSGTSPAPSVGSTCRPGGARPRERCGARGLPAAARRPGGRRPSPRAVEGEGHDNRPLGAHGHRHRAGVPDVPTRLPARRDRPVHERDRAAACSATSRRPGRRSSRSSARSISRRGSGSSTRPPTRSSRSPRTRRRSRSKSSTTACRAAREILTGKHAVGRVIARPFTGEPGNYERTPNRHDFSLEPRRPNYLSLVRDAGHKVYGVGKIGDIFAGQDIDESHPTKSNIEGIQPTERLLREVDERVRLREPRRDRHALGASQRPGQLPPVLAGLRLPPARSARRAARRRPAHRHLRPRLRPDHAVHRSLPRVRAACSRTSRGGTPRARSTKASSPTSARP